MLKLVRTSTGFLFISPLPGSEDFDDGGKFDIIWNMTDNLAFAEYEKAFAYDVLLGNIKDYNIPSSTNDFLCQLDLVVTCLQWGGSVLIHCLGGHGRTGMALACVLSRLEGLDAKEAINKTLRICQGPENNLQIEFVKNCLKERP